VSAHTGHDAEEVAGTEDRIRLSGDNRIILGDFYFSLENYIKIIGVLFTFNYDKRISEIILYFKLGIGHSSSS